MKIEPWSARKLLRRDLPGDCALIQLADSAEQFIKPRGEPAALLQVGCLDAEPQAGLRYPLLQDGERIRKFFDDNRSRDNFIVQCQAGIGRSQAVVAALSNVYGLDYRSILRHGTYNRGLYHCVLRAFGREPLTEPLVSMVVRVKYDGERALQFALMMRRQRYGNWELIFVVDEGRTATLLHDVGLIGDTRIRCVVGSGHPGYWGHPYRQLGINAAAGKYIALSNDDNYYVPGYLEQMVFALQEQEADLALCASIHRYLGWGVARAGIDLGAWIGKAELVRACPWPGNGFRADQDHIAAMKSRAKKVVVIDKPLFIKN